MTAYQNKTFTVACSSGGITDEEAVEAAGQQPQPEQAAVPPEVVQ